MSGSILSRVSTFGPSTDLTSLQTQVDANVGGFVRQATDLKSLAALSVAGASYRLGRIAMMGAGAGNIFRALSIGVGLAALPSSAAPAAV